MNTTRRLNLDVLGRIRTQLQERGIKRRLNTMPSFKYIDASHAVLAETMAVVEEYGPLCEVMYLMMAADHRVVQAEREVLRGALDLISEGKVRTAHMEAMLDAASRQLAAEGVDVRLAKVVRKLKRDPARAELSVALAAAVALADEKIVPEEQDLFMRLIRALGISEERANEILQDGRTKRSRRAHEKRSDLVGAWERRSGRRHRRLCAFDPRGATHLRCDHRGRPKKARRDRRLAVQSNRTKHLRQARSSHGRCHRVCDDAMASAHRRRVRSLARRWIQRLDVAAPRAFQHAYLSARGARIDRANGHPESARVRCRRVELHPPLLDTLTGSLLAANPDAQTHVLFSAHSLPQIAIDKGDPYATLVTETAHAIVERASLTSPWSIAYQSQGADGGNWLGPTIAQSIAQLDGVKKVLVFPIGFLSDHLETLYDLDSEAKQIIESRGLAYARVPALNESDAMIHVLAALVAHVD